MPNHFHFLIKIKDEKLNDNSNADLNKLTPLEKAFRDFFISYSKTINNTYNRTGALFQYKFKRKLITDHNYLTGIIVYIHLNPIRAKLCKAPNDWKFSSYDKIITKIKTNVRRDEVIEFYGSKENLILYHRDYHDFQKERGYLF